MHRVTRSAIVAYSAEQMYRLVVDVDRYPEYLNWCQSGAIIEQTERIQIARISVNYKGFKNAFVTRNALTPNREISMNLVAGPFQHLQGRWEFIALEENACKISLDLSFQFKSRLLASILARAFAEITSRQVDAFCRRAEDVYG